MKPLLFKRLKLQNFGVHVATTINFSERSAITILTGANGSGKTMVMEALQLVLGFTPKSPRRRKGQATYVAEDADHALVDLTLRNPIQDGERLLKSTKPRLSTLLAEDEVTIRLKINRDSTSQHYLVTNKGKGLGRPITKEELHEMLRNIDINTKNMLVFTEEGTITEFSKKTPLMRFRTFLEVTGLAEYHDEMTQLLSDIKSFKEKITPLKERLAIEQKRAQLLEQRANEYKEKVKLQSQLEDTQRLYQWVEIISLEREEQELKEELEQYREALTSLTNEKEAILSNLELLKQEKNDLERNINLLDDKITATDIRLGELHNQKKHLIDSKAKNQEQVETLQKERERILQLLQVKNSPQENERLEMLRKSLQEVERQLHATNSRIQTIEAEKERVENQLKNLGKPIASSKRPHTAQRPTNYELKLLTAARAMRNAAKKHPHLSEQLVGPVFNLIRIKNGHERWEGAVKRLCGRHLYSFIAMSRDAYEAAKRLYDQLDPNIKSHVEVARYEPEEANSIYKEPLPNAPPEIHDWAINVLEGDLACLWWLSKNINGVLAENSINPNIATDFAVTHKVSIITQDQQSYYLPKGAFAGPPAPMVAPLGRKLDELTQFDALLEEDRLKELREQLTRLQEEHHAMREQRLNLLEEKRSVQSRIRQLTKGEEELELELTSLELKIQNLIDENKTLEDQLKQLDEMLTTTKTEKESLTNNRNILKKNLETINKNIFTQEKRVDDLERETNETAERMARLEDKLDDVQDQLDQKLKQAFQQGNLEKPSLQAENLPHLEDLHQEMAVLSARINQIKATEKDEEEYLKQIGKVEELRAYLNQREEHLNGLQEDFEKRLNEWKEKLLSMIEIIGKNLNELLGYKYEVRLRVSNIHRLDHSELEILVRERFKIEDDDYDHDNEREVQWRDLSHLSGGEKQLVAEAFFLALHLTVNTPLHAIDEFTQRLDRDNVGLALGMVQLASEISTRNAPYQTQFLLIAPELEGYVLDPSIKTYTFIPASYQA